MNKPILYIDMGSIALDAALDNPLIAWFVILPLFIPLLAASIRRIHDTGRSGWFYLVPIYNIILLIQKGTPGDNRFGPPVN